VYILRLILFQEFLNVANEEKFTILGGKLFQTFSTRSLKSFSACSRAAERSAGDTSQAACSSGHLPSRDTAPISRTAPPAHLVHHAHRRHFTRGISYFDAAKPLRSMHRKNISIPPALALIQNLPNPTHHNRTALLLSLPTGDIKVSKLDQAFRLRILL